jgi:hypothetical protein
MVAIYHIPIKLITNRIEARDNAPSHLKNLELVETPRFSQMIVSGSTVS